MPKFTGKFEYLVDGKKVTQEQFQQLVDGREENYNISIDNLRVVASGKGYKSEPFFLDEFIFPAKNNIKFTSLVIPHKSTEDKVKTEELRGYLVENQRFNNLDTIVKIMQADNEEELKSVVREDEIRYFKFPPYENISNTGGTVFEKVQDSTLDTYNAIVGHSTRHKANKDLRNDSDNQNKSSAIRNESPLLGKSPVFDFEETAKQIILNFGEKHNKNKPQLSILFKQFPKALEALAKCSEYGNQKYKETDKDFLNFKRVSGGSKTYADAGLRHRLETGLDESGLPHQYHVCWNALAELQLWIEENEN